MLTLTSPGKQAVSDARTRASTIFFMSRCNLLWKSLNMVDPPDKTIFCNTHYKKKNYAQKFYIETYLKHVMVLNRVHTEKRINRTNQSKAGKNK